MQDLENKGGNIQDLENAGVMVFMYVVEAQS
jgi:hypothetical protein